MTELEHGRLAHTFALVYCCSYYLKLLGIYIFCSGTCFSIAGVVISASVIGETSFRGILKGLTVSFRLWWRQAPRCCQQSFWNCHLPCKMCEKEAALIYQSTWHNPLFLNENHVLHNLPAMILAFQERLRALFFFFPPGMDCTAPPW